MIQNLDTIFHYTKMNVAIEHILGESRLRLSRGFNTHDPREYGKWNLCPHLEGNAISDRDFSREWHKAEIALNDVTRSTSSLLFAVTIVLKKERILTSQVVM